MGEIMKEILEKYKQQFKEVINDLKTPGRRYRQIPNILTGSRLLSPFIIIPSVITGNFALAGLSTALFATTDLFDGMVARKLGVTSEIGKDLDAFTDKVFVGTLLISLVIANPVYLLPLIMESTIAGINVNKKIKNQNPESHLIGKVKMTSLYVLIALGYINMYVKVPQAILNTLFISTIGLQTATTIDYAKTNNIKEINDEKIEINSVEHIEDDNQVELQNEKVKEQTITEKYLSEYRNLREIVTQQKGQEETENINDDIKIHIKKNDNI